MVDSSSRFRRRFISLARREHVFEHLVDRVLVLAGPLGHHAADVLAHARDEARGLHVAGVLRPVGEQTAQVTIVEVRMLDAVMAALALVVRAQRLAQRVQRFDAAPLRTSIGLPATSVISSSMYSSFFSAGQSTYRALPVGVRIQPDRKGLREVLVRMALRVPAVEVQDEALAVRLRACSSSGTAM